MATFWGAASEELREHASRLRLGARRLEELEGRLAQQVKDRTLWYGLDAESFRERFATGMTDAAAEGAERLDRCAAELDQHAEEQDRASLPDGAGAGAGAGTHGTVGTGMGRLLAASIAHRSTVVGAEIGTGIAAANELDRSPLQEPIQLSHSLGLATLSVQTEPEGQETQWVPLTDALGPMLALPELLMLHHVLPRVRAHPLMPPYGPAPELDQWGRPTPPDVWVPHSPHPEDPDGQPKGHWVSAPTPPLPVDPPPDPTWQHRHVPSPPPPTPLPTPVAPDPDPF